MSILIKGMEMPKSCDVCPFMKTNDDLMSDDYRHMYCDFPYMGEYVTDYIATRHRECPLVEVPAPHGRLIDADELPLHDEFILDGMAIDVVFNSEIEQAPTIIEAEE